MDVHTWSPCQSVFPHSLRHTGSTLSGILSEFRNKIFLLCLFLDKLTYYSHFFQQVLGFRPVVWGLCRGALALTLNLPVLCSGARDSPVGLLGHRSSETQCWDCSMHAASWLPALQGPSGLVSAKQLFHQLARKSHDSHQHQQWDGSHLHFISYEQTLSVERR